MACKQRVLSPVYQAYQRKRFADYLTGNQPATNQGNAPFFPTAIEGIVNASYRIAKQVLNGELIVKNKGLIK